MTEEKTGFTVADIERIADLANLELSAVEKETFAHQFENILAYFRKIESVDTENIPAYGGTEPDPHFRPDRTEVSPVSPDQFSSYLEDGHFKVPRVID